MVMPPLSARPSAGGLPSLVRRDERCVGELSGAWQRTWIAAYAVSSDSSVTAEEGGSIQPTREDFENNLRFRATLRRFLHWSEEQAAAAGLTAAQHQLLVAIKGHPGPEPPAIRDIAEYLLLQSHSAVGLVDRAEVAGVVYRQQDGEDARVVRVRLTKKGDRLVESLTAAHLAELYQLAEALNGVLKSSRGGA